MNLTGKLLVSMPSLEDERFYKTVIYICAHSSEGTMGIIINKPALNINFQSIFGNLKISQSLKKLNKPDISDKEKYLLSYKINTLKNLNL